MSVTTIARTAATATAFAALLALGAALPAAADEDRCRSSGSVSLAQVSAQPVAPTRDALDRGAAPTFADRDDDDDDRDDDDCDD